MPFNALLAISIDRSRKNAIAEVICLRIGLHQHQGSSIMVTLNERLDYFGSIVNLAARLQSEAEGGEIVMSLALLESPEIKEWIKDIPHREEVRILKGFAASLHFPRIAAVKK